jgi:uridine kinase
MDPQTGHDLVIEGMPLADIQAWIASSIAPDRTFTIGIDGGAGAGKTTFTRWFARRIATPTTPVATVHIDHFCRPSAKRDHQNAVIADLDWQRLRDQVLVPLSAGGSARFQLYDWPIDRLAAWETIDPGGAVIVDGVTALRQELGPYYDLAIYLSCPREIRVARLLGRGDTPVEEVERWVPSEERYLAAHDPQSRAHLVVDTAADQSGEEGRGWFVCHWWPSISSKADRATDHGG